jgi:hypothetical protein
VIVVPFNSVDTMVMTFVSLQVLSRVSLGTEMDLAFFSTYEEEGGIELVEIEAHTSGESVKEVLLLVIGETLGFIDDESELNHFFGLQLILHKSPVGDATIGGNTVEI